MQKDKHDATTQKPVDLDSLLRDLTEQSYDQVVTNTQVAEALNKLRVAPSPSNANINNNQAATWPIGAAVIACFCTLFCLWFVYSVLSRDIDRLQNKVDELTAYATLYGNQITKLQNEKEKQK